MNDTNDNVVDIHSGVDMAEADALLKRFMGQVVQTKSRDYAVYAAAVTLAAMVGKTAGMDRDGFLEAAGVAFDESLTLEEAFPDEEV